MQCLRLRSLVMLLASAAIGLVMIVLRYRTEKDQMLFLKTVNGPTAVHVPSNIQHQLDDYNELVTFWSRKQGYYFGFMPSIYDVEYNNKHWQVFRNSNVTMFAYSAFYDQRHPNETYVRIVALVKNADPSTTTSYCHFWFEDVSGVVSAEVTSYHYLWQKTWGNPSYDHLQPYLVSCKVPADLRGQVPVGVSLSVGPRKRATTLLPVVNTAVSSNTDKRNFAVCVKGLNYIQEDISQHVTEWLELMRALGVGKVFMYEFVVQPNVQRVLLQYQEEGFVELRETTLPDSLPNHDLIRHFFLKRKITDKRQMEVIIYNDCFFRSIGHFDYIALLDIDEIIFPLQDMSWKDMKIQIDRNISLIDPLFSPSCYCFHNFYFTFDVTGVRDQVGVPSILNLTQRALLPTDSGSYTKCLHDSRTVLAVHNHYPLYCVGGQPCSRHFVDTLIGRLNHYRGRCASELTQSGRCPLDQTVFDDSISKFRSEVERQLSIRRIWQ